MNSVSNLCGRSLFVRFSSFFILLGLGTVLLFFPSCSREESDYGAGQRAHHKETELRNKTLLEQFVLASEELENHPDASYFENALLRLNPWLDTCAASRDFRPSEEYAEKGRLFQSLAESAEAAMSVCMKAGIGGEKASSEGGELTDEDLKLLSDSISLFIEQLHTLNADFRSPLLAHYEEMASDLKAKTEEAGGFQFGNQKKMTAAAIAL